MLSKNIAVKKKKDVLFCKAAVSDFFFFIFNACPISGLVLMLMGGIYQESVCEPYLLMSSCAQRKSLAFLFL